MCCLSLRRGPPRGLLWDTPPPHVPEHPIQGKPSFRPAADVTSGSSMGSQSLVQLGSQGPPHPPVPSCQPDSPHFQRGPGLCQLALLCLGIGQKRAILSVLIHNLIDTDLVIREFMCQRRYLWKVRVVDNISF